MSFTNGREGVGTAGLRALHNFRSLFRGGGPIWSIIIESVMAIWRFASNA